MRIALHCPPRGTPVSVDSLAEHILETKADLFVAPEYFVQNRGPIKQGFQHLVSIPKTSRDNFVESLCEKTKDADTLIIPGSIMWHFQGGECVYNSTPAIHRGEVIAHRFKEYGARSDTLMAYYSGKRFSGEKSPETFTHNGMSYRLDICYDIIEQNDPSEYDIHIAVCSRMPKDLFTTPKPRARKNGLFIVIDNREEKQTRRLGKALVKRAETTEPHYHMPIIAQSYEHTEVFEVKL